MGTVPPTSPTKRDGVATMLSFLCPGLGHIYLGAILRGAGMIILMLVIIQSTLAAHRDDLFWQGILVSEIQVGGQTSAASMHQSMVATYWFLGSISAAVLWWIWGMVSARRLAQRLGAATVAAGARDGSSSVG